MLWRNLNFWRVSTFALFAVVLAFVFISLPVKPRFQLDASSMEIVQQPRTGALFKFTISNDGSSGEAYVFGHAYLYERGGDMESDYTIMGVNGGDVKDGELFIPLNPGQTVHDWRIEIVNS